MPDRKKIRFGPQSSPGTGAPFDSITPAGTVVLLRESAAGAEVLLLHRSDKRGAFGGFWVFPGGKVELQDLGTPLVQDADPLGGDEWGMHAARRAAAREALEEAGIVLWAEDLVPLSFWVPPEEAERRFSTWFFLAQVSKGDVVVDRGEVLEHRWMNPGGALESRDRGEIQLAPPTWTTLWGLSSEACAGVDEIMAHAAKTKPRRFVTRAAMDESGRLLATYWEGDSAFVDSDLARPGPRRRLVLGEGAWRMEWDG